jgi:3-hydroxy-9,10-secoandrosta-1,3,5(10)-triene-9,17-dione monooxygenase reductase component
VSQDFDARALRTALGAFATGVTIVSCRRADGEPVGLTVNSFNALSLDPPLVLWSLRLSSPSLAAFDAAGHFAVHVLGEAQVDLSRRFASPLPSKFDEGAWHEGLGGVPLLAGCAASFECERLSRQDAGDHRLYIGRVLRMQSQPVPPLVFHRGHYHLLGEVL